MLSPEFLGALENFVFIPKVDQTELDWNGELISRSDVVLTEKILDKTLLKPKFKAVEERLGLLTMNVKIHEIEVIFIENSLKPKESQALILSFNTFLNAKNVGFYASI